ncbi:PHD-finger protein [Rhizoctonia solani AG-3 Rhs1AP]|uniref:PHD-finger protein n=2 Tax=Rhizoctonia solani AG-3 TaxID=1086053 RepID=A0A074SCF6_9AGAM|nr:PHD-finger protein [Rhizoctonia solani AG-3 Rhs1AP]KEP54553.1 PHD-finger protein [Rhizoctonia solani 123E]
MTYTHEEYDDPEDEVTRCVCGSEEEVGDFMIQCEQCFVWQHGLCVGLVREEDSPEHYFCERCRPENHAALLRCVVIVFQVRSYRYATVLSFSDILYAGTENMGTTTQMTRVHDAMPLPVNYSCMH